MSASLWAFYLKVNKIMLGSYRLVDLPGHNNKRVSNSWESFRKEFSADVGLVEGHSSKLVLHSFSCLLLPFFDLDKLENCQIYLIEPPISADDEGWTHKPYSLSGASFNDWYSNFISSGFNTLKYQLVNRPSRESMLLASEGFKLVDAMALRVCFDYLHKPIFDKKFFDEIVNRCSVKILFGSRTRLVRSREEATLLNAEIFEIASSAHFPMIDNPRGLANVIYKK